MSAFAAAAMHDPDVLRALIECVVCVSVPHEAMRRPHVAAKIAEFKKQFRPRRTGMSGVSSRRLLPGKARHSSVLRDEATGQSEETPMSEAMRVDAIHSPCRVRADPETGPPVGQPETPQGQVSLQLDRMFAASLIPLRVISESGGRHTELIGHECDDCPRRLFSRAHAEAGIPKEAQLDGLFVRISARSSPPST